MYCWYCYWGWPKEVADIYQKALAKLDGRGSPLHFGPSHVVWEDENFDSAEWCIENFYHFCGNFNKEDLDVVMESLVELEKIPLEKRCVEPEYYDGEHPENFPPPAGVEMVKI